MLIDTITSQSRLSVDIFTFIYTYSTAEIVSMTARMLCGDEKVVGCMTSGGTERYKLLLETAVSQFLKVLSFSLSAFAWL